ncbi:MAG: hypothetical protein ACR2OZ_07280 [Verrucomicrobiales bacterium]
MPRLLAPALLLHSAPGHGVAEAQDLTQEFFARLLERDYLARVDQQRGKFRSFLLAFVKHFLSEAREKAGAQKRGGGQRLLSLDAAEGEEGYLSEPVDELTPEQIFERRWVQTLLQRDCLHRLPVTLFLIPVTLFHFTSEDGALSLPRRLSRSNPLF